MIIGTIIFSLIFIAYNYLMFRKFGQLWSISEGYYKLKGYSRSMELIFILFLYLIAAYMIFVTIYTDQVLFFLAGIGAAFVGTAAAYDERITKSVHYIGSAVLIGSAATGCVVMGNWWVLASISCAGIAMVLLWSKVKNTLYWFEILSFVVIVVGIII